MYIYVIYKGLFVFLYWIFYSNETNAIHHYNMWLQNDTFNLI